MLRKIFRSFAYGAVFAIGLASIPGFAAALSNFTPPYGGNPAQCNLCISDYTKIINGVNAVLSYVTATPPGGVAGELEMLSPNAFAANGTVATSLTSLGPTGSHTTVQEWLQVIDYAGNVRYLPAF